MKEIRETKMVEQTTVTYVADDGKVFTDEFECKYHEQQRRYDEMYDAYRRVRIAELNIPMMHFNNDTVGLDIVYMKNHIDYLDVKTWIRYITENNFDLAEPTSYPCTKLVAYEECYGCWSYEGGLEPLIDGLTQSLNKVKNAFPGWNDTHA